jgi:hypothetical protein
MQYVADLIKRHAALKEPGTGKCMGSKLWFTVCRGCCVTGNRLNIMTEISLLESIIVYIVSWYGRYINNL